MSIDRDNNEVDYREHLEIRGYVFIVQSLNKTLTLIIVVD